MALYCVTVTSVTVSDFSCTTLRNVELREFFGLVMRIRANAVAVNDMFGARGAMFTTCNPLLTHDLWLRVGQIVRVVTSSAFGACC